MKNLKNISIEEIESPRSRNTLKYTSNSNIYTSYYKKVFISCPICRPNKGCNRNYKTYFGYFYPNNPNKNTLRYPSWKLLGKTKKQWSREKLNIIEEEYIGRFIIKTILIK